MIDLNGHAEVGARVFEIVRRVEALDRFSPGMTADWGLEVDGHVFAFTVQLERRADEVPA